MAFLHAEIMKVGDYFDIGIRKIEERTEDLLYN